MFLRSTLETSALVIACFFVFCDDAHAQKLRFGLLAGASLTDDYRPATLIFSNSFPSGGGYSGANASQAWMAGASADFEFGKNFAVEVDAIRRRIRSTLQTTYPALPDGTPTPSFVTFFDDNFDWHFAVLGKYRLATRRTITPFVEAGATFLPRENQDRTGFTSGAGVEIPFWRLSIAPALRYTRWLTHPSLGAVQDHLEFVVGVREISDSSKPKAFGRTLRVGLVAGVGLTKLMRDRKRPEFLTAESSDFPTPIAGISVEVPLHERVSLEVNGLYRPTHDISGTIQPDGSIRYQEGNGSAMLTWTFPTLVKYRSSVRKVKPTFEIGPSFRLVTHEHNNDHSHFGVAGGAGVSVRVSKVNIEPMLRYTRWGADRDRRGNEPSSAIPPNQVELVVGFSF